MNSERTDGMRTQASYIIQCAYDRGYKDGLKDAGIEHEREVIIKAEELKKAYNDGLRDGLEAAKNGTQCTETKDLRIGDEVKFITIGGEFVRGVVIHRDPKDEEYTVLGGNGDTYYCYEAVKTGRHFDQVKEMLRDIRGE